MTQVIRHAMQNIVATPGKSLLSLILLSIFLTPLMVCISIQAGTQKGLAEAQTLIGNAVRLMPDYSENGSNPDSNGISVEKIYVTRNLAETLQDSQYVTGYSYYLWTTASSEMKPFIYKTADTAVVGAQTQKDGSENNLFRLYGYSRLDLQPDFKSGNLKLVSGVFPSESNNVELSNGIVISREFAEKNGLAPGSAFTIEDGNSRIKQEVVVTGVFDSGSESGSDFSYGLFVNSFFVPMEIAERFHRVIEPGLPEGVLTAAIFYLDDIRHYDEFIDEAKIKKIDLKGYILEQDDDKYVYATGLLRGLDAVSKMTMLIILVIGAVSMSAAGAGVLKRRKKEICVLLTAGFGKKQILCQFAAEIIILCLISITAAGFAGSAAATPLADLLLKERIVLGGSTYQSISSYYSYSDNYYKITDKSNTGMIVQIDSKPAADYINEIHPAVKIYHILLFIAAGLFLALCRLAATVLAAAGNRPGKYGFMSGG